MTARGRRSSAPPSGISAGAWMEVPVDSRLITAIEVVVGVPAALVAYIWLTERIVTLAPDRWQPRIRPWLWLGPALGFLGLFLIYPTVRTIIRSLYGKNEIRQKFVGLDNYKWFFTNKD